MFWKRINQQILKAIILLLWLVFCQSLWEKMITSKHTWFLESNGLLSPRQVRFRQYHFTVWKVLYVSQAIKDYLDKCLSRQLLLILNWPMIKYEDYVPFRNCRIWEFRARCFDRLRFSFHSVFLLLDMTMVHLVLNGQTGFPQGTVISPILFNVFINDLPKTLSP